MFSNVEETLFQILFVMTESVGPPSSTAFATTVVLFWIDLGQVIRILCSPRYGWSEETYDLMKTVDAVWDLANLVSSVLPRYSLWILAGLLVIIAIGDTFYVQPYPSNVAKVFKGGEKIKTMWPVKLLKFLVAATVTTLYSSMLKWLLIPIDCLVSSEDSMSVVLHGEGAPCQPWGFPDFIFSVSSICVAVVYIAFALATSLLSIETNPLARGARSASTGRVECFWMLCKVCQTFLMYFAVYIKPVTCAVVLLLLAVANLYLHVTTLPFQNHNTNVLRGGVYGCVVWLSLSAVIVSAGDRNQSREWLLVAFCPLFSVAGGVLVHMYRRHLHGSMERLRVEYQQRMRSLGLERRTSDFESASPSVKRDVGRDQDPQQGMVDKFYDKTWERRRAFPSETCAVATIRTMLHQRERRDRDLVLYLCQQACQEHPLSLKLQLLRLKLVRFLVGNMGEASLIVKRFRLERLALQLDQRYLVYAIQRKTSQESIGQSLGKGTYSAINVMEFDSGMDRASKAHKECLRALKRFWSCNQHARRQNGLDDAQVKGQAREMMKALDALQRSVVVASQQYRSLLQLYPSSSALLHSYAAFCDTVLYDQARAEHLRGQAESMDDEWDGASEKSEGRAKAAPSEECGQSTGGSDDFRGRMVKLLSRHSDKILATDYASVLRLAFRVRVSIVIIIVVTTAGFVLTSKFLLSDMATANIESIDQTQKFGVYAAIVMFNLRSMLLSARAGDDQALLASRARCEEAMDVMREQHRVNYESAQGAVRGFFLRPVLEMVVPGERGLSDQLVNFWDFGNEFARRAQRATLATAEELRNESYVLEDISSEKRNIAFVFDNTLQHLIPHTERLLDLYEDEVINIARLTSTLVWINVVVNSLLVLFISAILLHALRTTIPRLQPHLVLCRFSLELPKDLTSRLVVYYKQLEEQYLAVENEEMQVDQLMHSEDVTPSDSAIGGTKGMCMVELRSPPPPPTMPRADDDPELTRMALPETHVLSTSVVQLHSHAMHDGSKRSMHHDDDRVMSWVGRERQRHEKEEEEEHVEVELVVGEDTGEEYAGVGVCVTDQRNGARERTTSREVEESVKEEDEVDENEACVKEDGEGGAGCWDLTPEQNSDGKSAASASPHDEDDDDDADGEMIAPDVLGLRAPGSSEKQEKEASLMVVSNSESVFVPHATFAEPEVQEDSVSHEPAREQQDSSKMANSGADGMVTEVPRTESDAVNARFRVAAQGEQASSCGRVSSLRTPSRLPPASVGYPEDSPSRRRSVGWRESRGSQGQGNRSWTREESLKLPVSEAWQRELQSQSVSFRSWQNRTDISSLILLLVLAMCIFSTVYPTRTLPDIRDMAPMVDFAGRRHYQVQICAFLARELVLDDGFSRMTLQQLAGQLSLCSDVLLETYDAVRLGSGESDVKNQIAVGADERYEDHNQVMYTPGCPWREEDRRSAGPGDDDGGDEQDEEAGCELEVYPDAAKKGLHYLAMTFFEVLEGILYDFGPDKSTWDFSKVVPTVPSEFDTVTVSEERVQAYQRNEEIEFVTQMMDGDLFLGLDHIHEIFHHHTHDLLVTAQYQTELLYALYVVLVVVVFYLMVFRGILSSAKLDLTTVRQFVAQMPLHTLSPGEVHCVLCILVGEDEMRVADMHDRAVSGA